MDGAVFASGEDEPAASETKIELLLEISAGFHNEIQPCDSGIGGVIGDELWNVLSANENRFELSSKRCGESASPSCPDFQSCLVEQVAGVFRKSSLVG